MSRITKNSIVCAECGGIDIERKAWVNPNNHKFISEIEDDDTDDNWCSICEDHTEQIEKSEYDDRKLNESNE